MSLGAILASCRRGKLDPERARQQVTPLSAAVGQLKTGQAFRCKDAALLVCLSCVQLQPQSSGALRTACIVDS